VRIISRYILREHLGHLVFWLTALTSLLLLQYVARQLDKLVGKGLPWRVIGEFLVLSLPFTVAMTLPMALLMATLQAFGRLSAEHEVTAFKASGFGVRRLMAPVLVAAAVLSLLMIGFNDQVLPRANHRLAILLGDIVSVRPTVGLQAQVLKPYSETFYMRVGWIDDKSNRMREVEIYDLQNSEERKSVYADSGTFTLSPDSVDLQLVLYDGEQLQFPKGDSRQLQRTAFREQVLRVKGVARGFSSTGAQGQYKGEREQSICELQREYELRAVEYESRRQRWIAQLRAEAADAGTSDSVLRVPKPRPAHGGLATLYCTTIPGLFAPKTAEAAPVPSGGTGGVATLPARGDVQQDSVRQDSVRRDSLRRDSLRRAQDSAAAAATPPQPPAAILPTPSAGGMPMPTVGPDGLPLPTVGPDGLPLPTVGPDGLPVPTFGADGQPIPAGDQATRDSIAAAAARRLAAEQANVPPPAIFAVTPESLAEGLYQMNSYAVEVQKKFALSIACFVFVLFGPPIALRFPRGGLGMTLGISLTVFGAYYVCLMAGETLADKGRVDPIIAMWAANVIFTTAGLVMFMRVERTTDGSRGGGFGDWLADRKARKALRAARRTSPMAAPESLA
jgi:lipopolysaccharide export system permease protein